MAAHLKALSAGLLLACACGCALAQKITADRKSGSPDTGLRAAAIPAGFRDLVPYAMKWGGIRSTERDILLKEIEPAEARAFREAMQGRVGAVRDWVRATAPPTRESDAFSNLVELYQDLVDIELMKSMRARGNIPTPAQ